MRADYRAALGQMAGMRFDLVFLDPPYRMAEAYGDALSRLLAMGALGEGCRIVMERAREQAIALPEGFARVDARDYGKTSVEFVEVSGR